MVVDECHSRPHWHTLHIPVIFSFVLCFPLSPHLSCVCPFHCISLSLPPRLSLLSFLFLWKQKRTRDRGDRHSPQVAVCQHSQPWQRGMYMQIRPIPYRGLLTCARASLWGALSEIVWSILHWSSSRRTSRFSIVQPKCLFWVGP